MNKYLLILLFLASNAYAGLVAKDLRGNAVWLFEDACTVPPVLAKIHTDHQDKFKRAEMLYVGKKYAACWAVGPDGKVYILDDIGEMTVLPMQAFVPMLGS